MQGNKLFSATMRAAVYPPPSEDLPHVAIVFHADGTILLARPFVKAEEAQRYITDISSSLVALSATYDDPSLATPETPAEPDPTGS
jgi:hypothetical protein